MRVAVLVGSLIWLVAILLAPLSHEALSAGTYLAGGFICHQRPDRSFHVAGRPMPVCARCTGLYASAPVGAIAALLTTRKRAQRRAARLRDPIPAPRVRAILLAAAIPTAAMLAAEWLGFAHPSGAARAVAAAPLGAATAWTVTRAIRTG